jgi:nuclear pore complex protein Nup205
MAEDDSLRALQGIHRDLCALIDLKLPVLDRLVVNLESRLDEFKALLDRKPKTDASRKALLAGKHLSHCPRHTQLVPVASSDTHC